MLNASGSSAQSVECSIIVADLNCSGCGRPLIKEEQFKCCRCKPKRLVPATLVQKAVVCPRHKEPVVLMRKDRQGFYRAYCQNRSCPNYKQRIGTIIKPKEEKMAEVAVEKVSKTQELRDWLEKEIERLNEDLILLAGIKIDAQSGKEVPVSWSNIRYVGLTSDESAAKMKDDDEKVRELKKYLEIWRLVKDIDIDEMEKLLCTKVVVDYNPLDYGRKGLTISGELTSETLKTKFIWSVGHVLHIWQHEKARGLSTTSIFWQGNVRLDLRQHLFSYNNTARWVSGNDVAIDLHSDGSINISND